MASIGSWERLQRGLPHFGFDTTLPVYLGVLPRLRTRRRPCRW
jgi:carotenoid cleavage dioxygenase